MDFGMTVGGPLAMIGPVAKRAEAAGYESIWVAETARTAYIQAAVALQATTTATVGTSIALAFPRSPVITAMTARDLAELSGGRFILGLGTQVKRVNELRYSTPFEHPAPKIREVIEVCREVWGAYAGEPIKHEGRFYTVTMPPFPGGSPPPSPIPVGVAAVNPMMVSLAGEICDVYLGHPFNSVKYFDEIVRPALDAGAEKAGRKPSECRIAQGAITSIGETTEAAIAGAKLQIGFYGTTRTYAKIFEIHGWGHMTDALREKFARGDMQGMIDTVTDEMAEAYSIFGTPDEVRDKVKRWEGRADELILGPPWASPDMTRTEETFEAILETFAPAR